MIHGTYVVQIDRERERTERENRERERTERENREERWKEGDRQGVYIIGCSDTR